MAGRLAALAVTVGLSTAALAALLAPPSPADAAGDAVEWVVDDAARTITATVHMDVFIAPTDQVTDAVRGLAVRRAAQGIKAQAEAVWSKRAFACYTFILDVDIAVVADRSKVGASRVGVRLDAGVAPALQGGSKAAAGGTTATDGDQYLSDAPKDRIDPATGPVGSTTWPLVDVRGVWSHEMGHVLGLQDNYVEADNSQVRPGAARDLMFSQGFGPDATTIARLIRRSGKVDEAKLNCGVRLTYAGTLDPLTRQLTQGLGGFVLDFSVAVDAKACGVFAPSNDPTQPARPMEFKGTVTITGAASFPLLGMGDSGKVDVPFVQAMQPGRGYFEIVATGGGGVLELGQQVDRSEGLPVASGLALIHRSLGTTAAFVFEWLPPGPCP